MWMQFSSASVSCGWSAWNASSRNSMAIGHWPSLTGITWRAPVDKALVVILPSILLFPTLDPPLSNPERVQASTDTLCSMDSDHPDKLTISNKCRHILMWQKLLLTDGKLLPFFKALSIKSMSDVKLNSKLSSLPLTVFFTTIRL